MPASGAMICQRSKVEERKENGLHPESESPKTVPRTILRVQRGFQIILKIGK